MTPEEYLKNRSFLIEEPSWSDWTREPMNLYYELVVIDPKQATNFLKERGFKFDNDWQEYILDFISDDISDAEKENWFFNKNNGFEVRQVIPDHSK